VRQHGTPWDTGQSRTRPDSSAFVRNHESSAFPDGLGHTPLGVSGCPERRGAVRTQIGSSGSLLNLARGGDHGAPEVHSQKKTQIGLHRYGR